MQLGYKTMRSAVLAMGMALGAFAFGTLPASAQDDERMTDPSHPDFPMKAVDPSAEANKDLRPSEEFSPPGFEAGESDLSVEGVPPGNPARSQSVGPSVLAILAHPDDELFFAPVLARMARDGGNVTLVFATSGDAGPGVSGMEPGEDLAKLREDEGRCSAFALGIAEPQFWQMGDGTLGVMARRPDSAMRGLKQKIADLIERTEPMVIMTWGPDGGYGHSDHRAISNAVTEIVQTMGSNRPDLLYPALPASEGMPGELSGWAKTHPSLITDRLLYQEADLDVMRIAADCYQSQFDAPARTALPDLLHSRVWQGRVFFRLAFDASE